MKEDSSHTTRFSDSSLYDYICTKYGATDAAGDDRLHSRCPAYSKKRNKGKNTSQNKSVYRTFE